MDTMNTIKHNEFLDKLRDIGVIVTIICFSYSGSLIYEKYNQLKSEYRSKIHRQIYDEIFCCDFSYNDEERENQEIADKYNSETVAPKMVDHWIKIKLSTMGSMEKSLYNYYFRTWDRKSVRNEIKDYKIKCEQKMITEKYNQQQDSFNYVRGLKYEKVIKQKVKEAYIISFFPISYLVGIFFGTIIIPFIFWLNWHFYKSIRE